MMNKIDAAIVPTIFLNAGDAAGSCWITPRFRGNSGSSARCNVHVLGMFLMIVLQIEVKILHTLPSFDAVKYEIYNPPEKHFDCCVF